jgi:hypothetical protein
MTEETQLPSKSDSPSQGDALNAEVLRDFLELQKEELHLRGKELDLRKIQIEQGGNFNLRQMEENSKLIQKGMEQKNRANISLYWFAGILVFLFVGVIVLALFLSYVEFALDLIKIVVPAVITGFGGYFAGQKSVKSNSAENSSYVPYAEVEEEP